MSIGEGSKDPSLSIMEFCCVNYKNIDKTQISFVIGTICEKLFWI